MTDNLRKRIESVHEELQDLIKRVDVLIEKIDALPEDKDTGPVAVGDFLCYNAGDQRYYLNIIGIDKEKNTVTCLRIELYNATDCFISSCYITGFKTVQKHYIKCSEQEFFAAYCSARNILDKFI